MTTDKEELRKEFEYLSIGGCIQLAIDKLEAKDKEIEELKIQLSNYAYQIDMAKRERDSAVNSYLDQRGLNQSLAKQITDLKAEIERLRSVSENDNPLICNHLLTYVDDDNFQRCQNCNEIID